MRRSGSRFRRAMLAAGVISIAVVGCSGETGTDTTGPPRPASLFEFEATLRPAVQALLDAPGFEAVSLTLDEAADVNRSSWLDYRANGDHAVLYAQPEPTSTDADGINLGGVVSVDGVRLRAVSASGASEPWAVLDAELDDSGRFEIPVGVDLVGIAQGTAVESLADETTDITVAEAAGGGTLWVLGNEFEQDSLIRQWLIDENGILREMALRSATGEMIGGVATAFEHSFTPLQDPDPIVLPPAGAALDLDIFDVPDDVPFLQP